MGLVAFGAVFTLAGYGVLAPLVRFRSVRDALSLLGLAYLAGLPWVRIIHGKGTGKLRQGVREYLRASEVVKSHESGKENEGGDGVTVVKLALAD